MLVLDASAVGACYNLSLLRQVPILPLELQVPLGFESTLSLFSLNKHCVSRGRVILTHQLEGSCQELHRR